jgi:hypothetical protein
MGALEIDMRKRNGEEWCYGRTLRWMLASALLFAPAASGAVTWVGAAKARDVCPGLGAQNEFVNFTLDMEPGSSLGVLTFAGSAPQQAVTDWTVNGRGAYFSASLQLPEDGGPLVLYGWTRGNKMRGYAVLHMYTTGCLAFGKLKAVAQ